MILFVNTYSNYFLSFLLKYIPLAHGIFLEFYS